MLQAQNTELIETNENIKKDKDSLIYFKNIEADQSKATIDSLESQLEEERKKVLEQK